MHGYGFRAPHTSCTILHRNLSPQILSIHRAISAILNPPPLNPHSPSPVVSEPVQACQDRHRCRKMVDRIRFTATTPATFAFVGGQNSNKDPFDTS
ncbi:hypothetical protein ACFX1Q_029005 [Malus domestica]